jgi:hypothetical protein
MCFDVSISRPDSQQPVGVICGPYPKPTPIGFIDFLQKSFSQWCSATFVATKVRLPCFRLVSLASELFTAALTDPFNAICKRIPAFSTAKFGPSSQNKIRLSDEFLSASFTFLVDWHGSF